MKHSTDYHAYVFKGGKRVGKFDDMYKYSTEIPWHQDKTAYAVFSNIDIAILKQFKYNTVCEIGCGLGYFSNRLLKELSLKSKKLKVTGIDISKTVVIKAAKKFPEIKFIAADLTKESYLVKKNFDLVVVKEVLWYVCHKLDKFLRNSINLIKDRGFLYVSQSFPTNDNWVGKEIIDSPEALKKILFKYASPVHYCIDWNKLSYKNGHIHFLGRIK